jgi:uncharacterized protein (DUF1330 family)
MPKGYWIARVDVRDEDAYRDYITANAKALTKFGARFIVRGGPIREPGGSCPGSKRRPRISQLRSSFSLLPFG